MLIVTPLTFLGGAFYSIDMLAEPWRTITLFNPVVYLINGFRWTFFGTADVPLSAQRSPRPSPSSLACLAGVCVDLPDRLPAQAVASRLARIGRRSWSARLGALAVEVLGDEVPVDDVAEHRLGELAAARCDSRCNKHAPTHRA